MSNCLKNLKQYAAFDNKQSEYSEVYIQVPGDKKKGSEINVAINNTVIERVQSFNFLDVKLNETLSWKNHLAMVSKKISKVIGILYRL